MHENVIEKERSYREHSVHRPSTRPSSDRSCWVAEMPLNLLVLPEPHDRAKMSGGAIEALGETASFSGSPHWTGCVTTWSLVMHLSTALTRNGIRRVRLLLWRGILCINATFKHKEDRQ